MVFIYLFVYVFAVEALWRSTLLRWQLDVGGRWRKSVIEYANYAINYNI